MSEEHPETGEAVATGNRRAGVRYEPDPAQLVRVRATFPPDGPLAPEDASPTTEAGPGPARPVQDVAVARDAPSVWDARPPPEDEADPPGTAGG